MRPPLFDGDTAGACLANVAKYAPYSVTVFPTAGARISTCALDEAASKAAQGFLAAGIKPGDIVGVLVPPTPWFLTTLFGLWRAGAAVSVLPIPVGFADAGAGRRLDAIVRSAGMRHVVADDCYAAITEHVTIDHVSPGVTGHAPLPSVSPDDVAVVQFTSGSTSAPKGVVLPHRNLVEGLRACVLSAAFSPDDVFVQWVPTYHDMGLIGLCSHLLNGADIHMFSPSAFLRRPAEVLTYFAEQHATVIAGPNFSYDHMLDAVSAEQLAALDLSRWRLAFNGAEPVQAATVRRFTETLAPAGVRDTVMFPVYGMAEATLSISYPELGASTRIITVDRDELATTGKVHQVAPDHHAAKELVSVGRAVHGLRIDCPQEMIGEIRIAGPSLCTGYLNDPFDGEWFPTGDLGFQLDGDLFVAGRRKEMVIVHGQNFFPDDVEAIAREVPGVYRGRCAAYSDVDEHIEVIVESDGRTATEDELRTSVTERVSADLGLSQIRVHVVTPRWLTRTTSGKLQRALAQERLNGGL